METLGHWGYNSDTWYRQGAKATADPGWTEPCFKSSQTFSSFCPRAPRDFPLLCFHVVDGNGTWCFLGSSRILACLSHSWNVRPELIPQRRQGFEPETKRLKALKTKLPKQRPSGQNFQCLLIWGRNFQKIHVNNTVSGCHKANPSIKIKEQNMTHLLQPQWNKLHTNTVPHEKSSISPKENISCCNQRHFKNHSKALSKHLPDIQTAPKKSISQKIAPFSASPNQRTERIGRRFQPRHEALAPTGTVADSTRTSWFSHGVFLKVCLSFWLHLRCPAFLGKILRSFGALCLYSPRLTPSFRKRPISRNSTPVDPWPRLLFDQNSQDSRTMTRICWSQCEKSFLSEKSSQFSALIHSAVGH